MSVIADNTNITADSLLREIERVLSAMSGGNALLCHKAAQSFRKSLARSEAFGMKASDAIQLWQADMILRGIKPLTMRRYLESVRALCNKAGLRVDIFDKLPEIPQQAAAPFRPLTALRHLAAIARKADPPLQLAADTFLFSIIAGGLTLEKITRLKLSDPEMEELLKIPQIRDIISRYEAPHRKYALPLGQGRVSSKRFAALPESLRRELLPVSISHTALHVALEAGLTIPQAAAFTGQTILGIIPPPEISGEELPELRCRVAQAVSDMREHWYAMRLRRGVAPADIEKRLADTRSPKLKSYYPCEQIVKRVDKKLTRETKAYISDVLFFRSDVAAIPPLFRQIGDLAWCYRTSAAPGVPYAAISDRDMRRFQRHIGQLSEHMDFLPAEEEAFKNYTRFGKGERVRILSGPMAGYEGEIITLPQGQQRFIRLAITSDRGLIISLSIADSELEHIGVERLKG